MSTLGASTTPGEMTPGTAEVAQFGAGPRLARRRRQRPPRKGLPYALVIPSVLTLVAVLGYPVLYLLRISFQHFERAQLFGAQPAEFIGFDNYIEFITGDDFVAIVFRTLAFTAACVGLSMVAGVGIALLMQRLSTWVRIPLLAAMMFAWAMPPIAAVAVFQWLFDYQYGVVNYLIDKLLPFVDFTPHHWFLNPVQGFAVIVLMITWGAVPFIAITVHAALTQVPQELVDAARIDGAGKVEVFRSVTYPIIKPVLLILTVLSIIWDFQIIAQILAMLNQTPPPEYFTLPVYSYMTSIVGGDFGLGAAAAVITVLALAGLTFVYLRRMLGNQEID